MVAHMKVHWYADVRDFRNGAHQSSTSFGNGLAVFKPKIEDVPNEMDFRGLVALGKSFA